MRIIAGKWKGISLQAGDFEDVRPITDRIKESLFGTLGDEIIAAKILDLFAGSGSVGIEALSRGANHCMFVERSHRVADILLRNLQQIKCDRGNYSIIINDVYKIIHKLSLQQSAFDFIFSDPPFRTAVVTRILKELSIANLLKTGGTLIVRHHKKENKLDQEFNFEIIRSKKYGDSILRYYKQII